MPAVHHLLFSVDTRYVVKGMNHNNIKLSYKLETRGPILKSS